MEKGRVTEREGRKGWRKKKGRKGTGKKDRRLKTRDNI